MGLTLNGREVKYSSFSGGERHLCISEILKLKPDFSFDPIRVFKIKAILDSSDSIMDLLLLVDAIRQDSPNRKINVTIPYFPYARQDRVCNKGESFSLKVMANLINSMKLDSVTIYDPHSDVTPALIDNCIIERMCDIIFYSDLRQFIHKNKIVLVSPDAGAQKKTIDVSINMNNCPSAFVPNVIQATKTRDTKTGEITSTQVYGNVKEKNVLIVDDICDGGRTFIELSKVLREKGANKIYLYVTHGIFSKGMDVLRPHFDEVFAYHTIGKNKQKESEFLKILSNK